MKTIDDQNAYQ